MSNKSILPSEIDSLIDKYLSGKNSYELSIEYNCSNVTILNTLRKNNIAIRSGHDAKLFSKQNDDVFENLDEYSTYWIGYILADGCITFKYSRWYELSLCSTDREQIYKFKSFLNTHKRVFEFGNKSSKSNNPNYNIFIRSPKIISKLFELGITQRKSLTATIHESLKNNRHFWRGVTDGDGCICPTSGKYPVYNLVGSKDTLDKFHEFASSITTYRARPRQTGKVWQININGNPALDIMQEIYRNSNISLDRKLKLVKELCYGKRDLGIHSLRCDLQ